MFCFQLCARPCHLVFIFQQVLQILDERRHHYESRTGHTDKKERHCDSGNEVNNDIHTLVHCIATQVRG